MNDTSRAIAKTDSQATDSTGKKSNRCLTDHEAMLAIQQVLDGTEWNSDTFEAIAQIVTDAGHAIRDMNDESVVQEEQ
jgi:hypothetical protein